MKITGGLSNQARNNNAINNHINSLNTNKDVKANKFGMIKSNSLEISKQGKNKSKLDQLNKQRQSIIDNKNDLISKTLERGGDIREIKSQIESYDEQLKNIDDQISKIQNHELNDKDKEKKGKKQQIGDKDNKIFNDIVKLDGLLTQNKSLMSVKNDIEGRAKVLEAEIKLDEMRGMTVKDKKSRLAELKEGINKLNESIGEKLEELKEETLKKNTVD
ncbi:hypothetical protein PV797_14495 [Clostridiaceae bacterium M8S5]|nr:hypothetical protein PV797_14495 [Clostridiaceae bacterium M8S5]